MELVKEQEAGAQKLMKKPKSPFYFGQILFNLISLSILFFTIRGKAAACFCKSCVYVFNISVKLYSKMIGNLSSVLRLSRVIYQ